MTADIYLRAFWTDKRLIPVANALFNRTKGLGKTATVNLKGAYAEAIWRPNIYFVDSMLENTPCKFTARLFYSTRWPKNGISETFWALQIRAGIGKQDVGTYSQVMVPRLPIIKVDVSEWNQSVKSLPGSNFSGNWPQFCQYCGENANNAANFLAQHP